MQMQMFLGISQAMYLNGFTSALSQNEAVPSALDMIGRLSL